MHVNRPGVDICPCVSESSVTLCVGEGSIVDDIDNMSMWCTVSADLADAVVVVVSESKSVVEVSLAANDV